MADAWSLDPDAWRAFDELATRHGWETGFDLIADMLTHPEDYEKPGDPQIAAMADAMSEWNSVIKDIGGYGALIFSGGISNIFIKTLMGRPEDIDKGDILTAILELGGAYGFGEAAKLLGKMPVIGAKLTPMFDDVAKSIAKFGVTDDLGKVVDDALKEATKKGAKEAIEETGEVGAKQAAKLAGRVAAEGAEEATEAGAKIGAEVIEQVIKFTKEDIPSESIDAAADYLRKSGFGEEFIKKFISEATQKANQQPLEMAINEGFSLATKATPNAGITPNIIKNLSLTHPTLKKFLTIGFGGGGALGLVGGGYFGIEGIRQAAFAGFMLEEAEQQSMFAQFFTSDDIQALARTVATTSLPIWDVAQNWASGVGEPISGISEAFLGEFGKGMTTGPALATHYTFTNTLVDKIRNLQERGAWTGLEYEGDLGILGDVKIISWGRPTDQKEIALFLDKNPEYMQYYEAEMGKLARENPALLYQLYYEGITEWYDLPGWMRDQIEAYKQSLKDWEYKSSRGELTGQDALNMAEAIANTIWYDQKDKNILQDAINAGNLVYTMVQKGEISEAKGNAFLLSLSAKLMNNNHTKGLLNTDDAGRINWEVLSDTELKKSYGTLTTIADKPELVFVPPNTSLSSEFTTPRFMGKETTDTDLVNEARDLARKEGIQLTTPPVTLRGEIAEKAKREYEEFAKSAAGTEGMRGVGAVGGLTSAEKEEMAKVPSQPGPEIEGLSKTESRWINALKNGTSDWATLQRLNPEVFSSLIKKGYTGIGEALSGPGISPGVPITPTPKAEPSKKEAVDQDELIKAVNQLRQLGMSNADIEKVIHESVGDLGAEGYFRYPTEGYSLELLQAMLASPRPEERATALQSLERLKSMATPRKEGGAYGYETIEVRTKPMTEKEALAATGKIAYGGDIDNETLQEIYEYLKKEGLSPTRAIGADLSEEAKKAVFEELGITEYKPTKEGYGTVYGVGRRTTGR